MATAKQKTLSYYDSKKINISQMNAIVKVKSTAVIATITAWQNDELAEKDNVTQLTAIAKSDSCPEGCLYNKTGCEIKDNISYTSGEKIYHIKGQKYYEETVINPDFGKRCFCSEEKAKQNGWRKAYN